MKCEIKSSCPLSGCQHTNPMIVDPDSNITRKCSIRTGMLAQGMTWKQARQAVQNSTGLSDLVLLQSNSAKDSGSVSCYCASISFTRKFFFVFFSVVNAGGWLWSLTKLLMRRFCFLFWPWPSKKHGRCLLPSKQLTNWNFSVAQFLHRVSEQNKWSCAVADLST